MRSAVWTTICMAAAVAILAAPAQAQQTPTKSTMDSVFTAEQARLGEEKWSAACLSCHEVHKGSMFFANWGGRALSELFDYMKQEMPKDNPGTLSPAEYAQVLAFMLKANGMPEGSTELPSDSALKTIKFDTVATKKSSPIELKK